MLFLDVSNLEDGDDTLLRNVEYSMIQKNGYPDEPHS